MIAIVLMLFGGLLLYWHQRAKMAEEDLHDERDNQERIKRGEPPLSQMERDDKKYWDTWKKK